MSTLFVSIRLDEATMARVDALVPQFSSEWRRATRSDVLRALIVVALSHYEREVASPRLPASRKQKRAKKGKRPSKGKG